MTLENYSTSDLGQPLVDKMNLHKDATDGKAPTDHTHGAGTAVCGAGDTAARPGSGNWIYHNTERGIVERIVAGVKVADLFDDADVEAVKAALGIVPPAAYIAGLFPSYKDADEVTIESGELNIADVSYDLASSVDKTLVSGASSTRYFIYAKAPSSGTDLSVTEIEIHSSAPVWNDTYKGWYYDGGLVWRCIGTFRTDISGNIVPFTLVSGWQFDNIWSNNQILDSGTATGAKTALGCQVPTAFGPLPILLRWSFGGSSCYFFMTHGIDSTSPINNTNLYQVAAGNFQGQIKLITDASAQVYYHTIGTIYLKIYQVAWKLPPGLAGTC